MLPLDLKMGNIVSHAWRASFSHMCTHIAGSVCLHCACDPMMAGLPVTMYATLQMRPEQRSPQD